MVLTGEHTTPDCLPSSHLKITSPVCLSDGVLSDDLIPQKCFSLGLVYLSRVARISQELGQESATNHDGPDHTLVCPEHGERINPGGAPSGQVQRDKRNAAK
jgi:hypothetical protein